MNFNIKELIKAFLTYTKEKQVVIVLILVVVAQYVSGTKKDKAYASLQMKIIELILFILLDLLIALMIFRKRLPNAMRQISKIILNNLKNMKARLREYLKKLI